MLVISFMHEQIELVRKRMARPTEAAEPWVAFPVSTRNKLAQKYINQGLNLSYAFNHAEAGRAFREAARLDPSLAMAYWGQALVLGPNINAADGAGGRAAGAGTREKGQSLMAKASPRERALISALEKRYTGKAEQRKTNDKAYADAMREVHMRFPDDLDIAMLYVESMMDLRLLGLLDARWTSALREPLKSWR